MFRFFFVPVVFCWLFVWLQWRVTFNTPQSTPKTKTAKKKEIITTTIWSWDKQDALE